MGESVVVFVGTYTEPGYRGRGEGIYAYRLSLSSGSLEPLQKTPGVANPSYIAIDPPRNRLYCVNELQEFGGRASGAATAFSIDPSTQALRRLNTVATEGTDPCHIAIDREAAHALVSNYSSGSVCVLPIASDGSLGPAAQVVRHSGSSINAARQAGPHVHSLTLDPAQRRAFVCDLGLDRLMVYNYDARAREPLSLAEGLGLSARPGAGPRHCAFHPSGEYLYLVNELDSTISVLRCRPGDARCAMLQTAPAAPGAAEASPSGSGAVNLSAAIRVSPSGKYLYASNRGLDSIVAYRIDEASGLLSYVAAEPSGGRSPRDFMIDPTGAFLLAVNQDSDSLAVFRVEGESGRLAKAAEIEVPSPVCVTGYMPR
jgi:6-phosphogluconolactonase